MLILFGIVLLACLALGAVLARSKAGPLLVAVATGLRHPWLMGALGPVGIATGAALLLGVGVGKARGATRGTRPS